MIHFVVHDENDSVGVVVVEGVKAGQKLNGWIMDQDKSIEMTAKSDIPSATSSPSARLPAGRRSSNTGSTSARPSRRSRSASIRTCRTCARSAGKGGDIMDLGKASFWGYKRENGRVGVRNH